jgi:hypothetical protein
VSAVAVDLDDQPLRAPEEVDRVAVELGVYVGLGDVVAATELQKRRF